MNRLLSITLVCLLQWSLAVASTFSLKVEVTPNGAGTLNTSGGTYEEGKSINLRTYSNTGYVFKGWYDGETFLTSSTSFNYTMPARDATVQARYEFDPKAPDNPSMPDTTTYYSLTAIISPIGAGSVNTTNGRYAAGTQVNMRAYNNSGYLFIGWQNEKGETVSSSASFTYIMPRHDSQLTALYTFDPSVPANPDPHAPSYTVTVACKPVGGGTFNTTSISQEEGGNVRLYAYTNTGYQFLHWENENGDTLSKEQNFYYVIPHGNSKVYGIFEFNPANPANPNKNYWNKELGELIIDDFTTGSLGNAASSAISGSNRSDVAMIIVAGRMNSNDFGIANNYTNCTLLDLSRVTGVTEVPSYAFDNTNLESVYLPATIEKIGARAFYGCSRLSSLTVYAMTPPTLESNVFTNVPEGLVVYVPAAALAQYQEAEGWKNFTLLPIQEDIRELTINLPANVQASDFAKMWLELTNTKSGQRMHYVTTDHTTYTFHNIIKNTSWNVVLRNERGDVFGLIDEVEVKEEDVTVTFPSLSKPQGVSLVVMTPEGNDVTEQTEVTWTDASGNYMAQGTSLVGLPIGFQLNYQVELSQELAMTYLAPQPTDYILKDGNNNVVCLLQPIAQVQISGKVKDAVTGLPLVDAVVSASQTFGGKYGKTLNAKTDRNGTFTLDIANVPTTMGFAATDYVSQTMVCDSLLDGKTALTLPDVSLHPITGATVSIEFTYTSVDGETVNWYTDYQNVDYTLFNVTKNRDITQYNVQYPQIVLMEEVADGDVIRLTATSRTNAFMPVTSTATVSEQRATASFGITELGKIQASFTKTGNAAVVGTLYDAAGKLLKTYDYYKASLTISDLADGQYTLVSMGTSDFFNTIYDIAQLPQTGLAVGTDYVQQTIEVKSGAVSTISIDEVPTLNESKLYYTGDNTAFTVNKSSIVVGNYLTLTGRIDFKPAYATTVSNVQMIVDLPESCEFVENSVMVGNSTNTYTLNGNRIIIPMVRYTDRVRFCVIPTLGGEYAPSAFAQFDLNGKTVTQPIGSAYYTAKDLSISVPSTAAKTSIPVSGTAIGTSNVDIYDNDVLIGQTISLANGTWATTCELNEPYNLSTHSIYAKITTKAGLELNSETVECVYDMNAIQVSKVTMYHYNPEMHKTFESVFDFQNPSTKPNRWTVYYPKKVFTYTVDFTNNSPEKVSNVVLYVHTANGQKVPLYPTYNEDKDTWIAEIDMGNRNDGYYPVNVSIGFDAHTEPLVDRKEIDDEFAAWQEVFKNSDTERNADIEAYWLKEDNAKSLELDYLLSQDSVDINTVSALLDSMIEPTGVVDALSYEDVENLYNQWIKNHEQWESTDAQSYLQMMLEDFYLDPAYDINNDFSYVIEQEDFNKICSQKILSAVDTAELSKAGYSVYNLNDGSSIYYYYSDELIDVIDVKNLKQYTIKIYEVNDSIVNDARRVSGQVAGYAQCMSSAIFGIKHLYSDIKDSRGASARDIASMLLSGLGDVLNNVSCYYDGFMKALKKSIVDRYEDAALVFKIEKQNANNIKEAIEGSMVAYKKEAADFEKRYYELQGYIKNHPNLNESQLKAYSDQLDHLYDSRQKALSNLAKENKRWNKVKSEIANIDLKLSKATGKKNNLISIIDKHLPLTLKKGIKFPKSIRFAGKLAGEIGIPLQVACAFLDGWELYDDIQAWIKVMDAINAIIPCEAQPERALSLRNEIYSSGKNHIIGGCSVVVGELGAIGVATVGAVPLSPTWWVEQAINVICEAGKAFNSSSSENRKRKLYADIRALKCKKEPKPDPDPDPDPNPDPNPNPEPYPGPDDNVQIDPSGFVYEGVAVNRVEGVISTIYYMEMVEDMYGDLHENIVKWDAEVYAQENPLFTDENGMYRWDVPQGLWQVKFEKEGYETTYSEWLPVPPPQLDINIAMKQNRQPDVKMARAFEDAVELEFDKYMMPELLTTDNIMVMQNGTAVEGTIELLNEEVSYEGEEETFASKVRFNAALPFTEKEVTLMVTNRVKSYAGIRMQDDFQQTFTIEQEIKQIVCDSLLSVGYGKSKTMTISVLPASASQGKTLYVNPSSSMILGLETNQVTIGNDGTAQITMTGELPGTTALTFSVDGTDKTAMTIANVEQVIYKTVAMPTVNIASGTLVEKGTEIVLTCATEGAIIYYTLDGSCPCDESANRFIYDGTPIIIDDNVIIKAIAVVSGMIESDVAEFVYTIVLDGIDEVTWNDKIQVYPLPLRKKMNVTAGGNVIQSVVISNIKGQVVKSTNTPSENITMDVGNIPAGIYIINVMIDNKTIGQKVIKVD